MEHTEAQIMERNATGWNTIKHSMSCLVVFLGLVMFIGLVMFMILNQPIVLLGRMREGTSLGYLPAIEIYAFVNWQEQ